MATSLGKRVLDYFDLRAPLPDAHRSVGAPDSVPVGTPQATTPVAPPATMPVWMAWQRELWPLVIYVANVVGVVAKQWYDAYQRTQVFDIQPSTFILAVVVSAVTFPVTYHNLQVESKPGLQLFLALQNGFFWQTVLGQVMR